MSGSLFNKVAGLQVCNSIKKRLQHRCFPLKFAKFSRTPILKIICKQLLLKSTAASLVTEGSSVLQLYIRNLVSSLKKIVFPVIKKTVVYHVNKKYGRFKKL